MARGDVQIVSVFVPRELLEEIKAAARDEERSMASHILYLIKRDLEQRRDHREYPVWRIG